MSPTTPTGSRVTSTSTPGRTEASRSPRDAQRLAGEELEDLAGARGLADRLGQRLALFAGEQRAEFVLAREHLAADRGRAPRRGAAACCAAQALARIGGGADGRLGLRRVGAGELADHVGEVRRVLADAEVTPVSQRPLM